MCNTFGAQNPVAIDIERQKIHTNPLAHISEKRTHTQFFYILDKRRSFYI